MSPDSEDARKRANFRSLLPFSDEEAQNVLSSLMALVGRDPGTVGCLEGEAAMRVSTARVSASGRSNLRSELLVSESCSKSSRADSDSVSSGQLEVGENSEEMNVDSDIIVTTVTSAVNLNLPLADTNSMSVYVIS